MITIKEAAERIIKSCLGLLVEERFLIIYDETTENTAQVLLRSAKDITRSAKGIRIRPGKANGEEPPQHAAEAMLECDVCILITKASLSHTKARRDASSKGVRIASMPGATEDMLRRTMAVDYQEVNKLTAKIKEKLDAGKKARITTDAGTDITISIEGREALKPGGILKQKGDFGNIPSGEACLAPVEGSAQGVFVIDASVLKEKVDKPIKVSVSDGYARTIEGGMHASQLYDVLEKAGEQAFNIAELGIGTNKGAIVTGNVLEDEKAYGTAHIAFGNNISFGGTVDVPIHIDGVFFSPTIYIDDELIIKDGKLII